MGTSTVFIVSKDAEVRDSIRELVESAGLQAEVFPTLQAFFRASVPGQGSCLVLDAHLGGLDDEESKARLAAACARMPGFLLTDRGDVAMAVRALKAGVVDVVQKPYKDSHLLKLIVGCLQPGPPASR